MAVGGLFSPVMRVLHCVVASRLAQNAVGRQPTRVQNLTTLASAIDWAHNLQELSSC